MPLQGRNQNTAASTSPLAPLAALSAYGGIESVIITSLSCASAIALCFGSQLAPALGGLGAALVVAGSACAIERLTRPLVLWGLGMRVYTNLTRLGGKATAEEVARIYAAGQTITHAELEALVQRHGPQPGAAAPRAIQ